MTDVTLEQNLAIKEAIEWGYEYHSNQLKELGYSHKVKDNEIEIYDKTGTFVGKSFLAKEKQVSTRTFEAATTVPSEIADLSNELLFDNISLGYTVRDIEKHLHESQLDNIHEPEEQAQQENPSMDASLTQEDRELSYKSKIPEKLLSPSQIKAGQDVNPLTQKFMASNSFFPPMTIAKNGNIILHCSSQDLKGNKEPSITPVEIVLTPKQAAVLVDTSIKCQFVENRQSKQPTPLNLATKNKMEESFYLGLKTVHPQLSISEAEKQYNKVYSLIEKELKEFRLESREQQKPVKNKASMEW